MARVQSEKVGKGVCPQTGCGAAVTYRKSTGGLLTHRCDSCDSNGFAEPGGAAYKSRMASITGPAPEPKPAPAGEPHQAPTGRRAFSMADLA